MMGLCCCDAAADPYVCPDIVSPCVPADCPIGWLVFLISWTTCKVSGPDCVNDGDCPAVIPTDGRYLLCFDSDLGGSRYAFVRPGGGASMTVHKYNNGDGTFCYHITSVTVASTTYDSVDTSDKGALLTKTGGLCCLTNWTVDWAFTRRIWDATALPSSIYSEMSGVPNAPLLNPSHVTGCADADIHCDSINNVAIALPATSFLDLYDGYYLTAVFGPDSGHHYTGATFGGGPCGDDGTTCSSSDTGTTGSVRIGLFFGSVFNAGIWEGKIAFAEYGFVGEVCSFCCYTLGNENLPGGCRQSASISCAGSTKNVLDPLTDGEWTFDSAGNNCYCDYSASDLQFYE